MDYNLNRFLEVQETEYETALSEIRTGCKYSHWIWFIFPQHKDLGISSTSKFYGIGSLDEAKQYLEHPILGKRLCEITVELLKHKTKSAEDIFGHLDALKVKSCMTLFDLVEPNAVFSDALSTFYNGKRDEKTLQLLGKL